MDDELKRLLEQYERLEEQYKRLHESYRRVISNNFSNVIQLEEVDEPEEPEEYELPANPSSLEQKAYYMYIERKKEYDALRSMYYDTLN